MRNASATIFLCLMCLFPGFLSAETDSLDKWKPYIVGGLGCAYRSFETLETEFGKLGAQTPGMGGWQSSLELMQNPYQHNVISIMGISTGQWETNSNTTYTRLRSTSFHIGFGVKAYSKGKFLVMPNMQMGLQSFSIMTDQFGNQAPDNLGDYLSNNSSTNRVSMTEKWFMGVTSHVWYRLGRNWIIGLKPAYQFRFGKTDKWEGFMGQDLDGPSLSRHLFSWELTFAVNWP